MPPDQTLWPRGEHTPGKHLVLRNYLNAWLPILGMTQDRILFIDGFAGPGEYEGGEPGSPIIALRALKEHVAKRRFKAEVKFLFVEAREDRAEHLDKIVAAEKGDLPAGSEAWVMPGKFDATIAGTLDGIEATMKTLAPCFLMVDPFGVSGTPMSLIERVLRHPKSEVYISFMYSYINRFKATPEYEGHLDGLFGCPDWRDGIEIEDAEARKTFFFDLYRKQLKGAGATHVLQFELYRGNELIYAIFFGTKHLLGCDRMKQAIWKVDPFGDYAFRGTRAGQLGLNMTVTDPAPLADELARALPANTWVAFSQAKAFAQSDRTDYHTGHLKKALRYLEDAGRIEVDPKSRRQRRSFPGGTRFHFK